MIFSSGSLLLYFLFFLSAAKSHSIGLRSGEYGGRNNSIPVHLIRAKAEDGKDAWFILLCSYEKANAIDALQGNSSLDLREFGEVIAWGYGRDPDTATKAMLKKNIIST